MKPMKRFFFFLLLLLFCLNSLHAQKPVEGKDSLWIYAELFLEYYQKKDIKKAIYYGDKWKNRSNEVSVEKDTTYCNLVEVLASSYYNAHIYKKTISLLEEILPIEKSLYGEISQHYVYFLNRLSLSYAYSHNFSEAIRLCEKCLELQEKLTGKEHFDYAMILNNLCELNSLIGNYSECVRWATEALDVWKIIKGVESRDYSIALGDLARYHFQLGNYLETVLLHEESLDILKAVVGKEDPDYATAVCNHAEYNLALGNYVDALGAAINSLQIREKLLGKDHVDYAWSLSVVADCNYRLGDVSNAIRIRTEAAEIQKNKGAALEYAKSINSLSIYNSTIGNYSEAFRLDKEALKIYKDILGPEHPEFVALLMNQVENNLDINNYQQAFNQLKDLTDNSRNYLLRSFSDLSSDLQEVFWETRYSTLFHKYFPSTVYQHQTKESISELYDKTALFAKGILLNSSVGMRKLILESGDTVLISKYDALSTNKSIYEKQLEKPIKERFLNVDSLHTLIQQQEMELARESKAYGDFARNLRINWKDVQLKLDKNDIAIEFLDFPVLRTDSVMYVALTLKKGYDSPHMIPLFEKKQLDAISQRNYYTQTSLYDLVWKPLAEELKGARDIYFSPSGSLHRIGIEYVPVSDTENIFDQYRLHRLSSTRQLAFIQDETSGKESVLYGGLVYDAHPSQTDKVADNRGFTYMNRADVDSLSLRGSYEYLPGTKDEADNIASYLKKYGQSYVYHSGARGTEESFKQLDGSRPKTLHIATHGFYMTQEDAEIQRLASGVRLGDEGSHYQEDKPMTRSGLLLSGCGPALKHETLPEGVEDGILTAQEISKLDLRGLDLVVLSACQTGLGDIISGEGVFGLQRGFKNAGARTIIMSLWKVSDSATQQLMSSFYSHYLQGKRKEESFRLAQSELREKGSSNQSKPDWAAFVMLDGVK